MRTIVHGNRQASTQKRAAREAHHLDAVGLPLVDKVALGKP